MTFTYTSKAARDMMRLFAPKHKQRSKKAPRRVHTESNGFHTFSKYLDVNCHVLFLQIFYLELCKSVKKSFVLYISIFKI
jgi:hypothetical protein